MGPEAERGLPAGPFGRRCHAGQRPQLQAAERAWLAFRQQNCGYYASVSGTIRQILGADCMARMTRDRAVELQDAIRP
jgi:uncharacterized protein YecT (DUF1311 family)